MSTCLVTTLKEPVTDSSLLKLGEMTFTISPSNSTTKLVLYCSWNKPDGITFTIVGDGYFTNEDGTSNLGKTLTVLPSNNGTTTYVSSHGGVIVVSSKYDLIGVTVNTNNTALTDFDIEELQYAPYIWSLNLSYTTGVHGDTSKLTGGKVIYWYTNNAPNVKGTIDGAINKEAINVQISGTSLSFSLNTIAEGTALTTLNVSHSNTTGNISTLSNKPNLRDVGAISTSVTGSLSSLAGKKSLTTLYLDKTAITGDTSDLAGCTSLTTFTYTNTAITGTWPLT